MEFFPLLISVALCGCDLPLKAISKVKCSGLLLLAFLTTVFPRRSSQALLAGVGRRTDALGASWEGNYLRERPG